MSVHVYGAHFRSTSLSGEWDSPGVGDLALLQVLHQLGQPSLGGGVVFQHLGERVVLQLVGQTLPQGFSGSVAGGDGTISGWYSGCLSCTI